MQGVVLAAGFGERLHPYTRNTPKALLEVGGKPVIDHLLGFLTGTDTIDTIHIYTNGHHYPMFKEWLRDCDFMGRVELLSNGVSSASQRSGAVGDLEAVCSKKKIREDIVVAAADNIFDFSIDSFLGFCTACDGDVVAAIESRNRKALQGGGVMRVTSNGRVIDFEEKPKKPKSDLLALPLYRLSAETIPFLKRYMMGENDPDRIGSFFAWSYRRRPLFACRVNGTRYHLTDASSYRKMRSAFEKDPRS